jgi:glutaminase
MKNFYSKYFKSVNRRFGLFFWDERIWERVGVEPSGTAFNSLIQLEHEKVYQEIRLSMLERSS